MDSTLITQLFKFRRRDRKMIHITLMNLQLLREEHPSKHKDTWIPNSAAKPWSFLSQKCRDRMYNDMAKQSQVSNPENDLGIT